LYLLFTTPFISKMSNPFKIATQAIVPASSSTLTPIDLALSAIRPGSKPKPLAERKTLYALQHARRNAAPIAASAEGLLAQFKASWAGIACR